MSYRIDHLLTERRDYSNAVSLLESLQTSSVVVLNRPEVTRALTERFRDRVRILDSLIGTLVEQSSGLPDDYR